MKRWLLLGVGVIALSLIGLLILDRGRSDFAASEPGIMSSDIAPIGASPVSPPALPTVDWGKAEPCQLLEPDVVRAVLGIDAQAELAPDEAGPVSCSYASGNRRVLLVVTNGDFDQLIRNTSDKAPLEPLQGIRRPGVWSFTVEESVALIDFESRVIEIQVVSDALARGEVQPVMNRFAGWVQERLNSCCVS